MTFAPWRMIPPCSCSDARQEAGQVDEGDDREVESVAEAHEARDFVAAVDVEHAGQVRRLVGDHAHRAPVQAGKSDYGVGRVGRLHLQETVVVENGMDRIEDIVGLSAVLRHEAVQRGLRAAGSSYGATAGGSSLLFCGR